MSLQRSMIKNNEKEGASHAENLKNSRFLHTIIEIFSYNIIAQHHLNPHPLLAEPIIFRAHSPHPYSNMMSNSMKKCFC